MKINVNAVNWLTQKPYRGINTMLLEPGEYATFKQIKDAGGRAYCTSHFYGIKV